MKRSYSLMLEIPVESLNLFEQLDRNVVAFYRNEEINQTESLNINITQEHYDMKYKELQPLGYQAVPNSSGNGFRIM